MVTHIKGGDRRRKEGKKNPKKTGRKITNEKKPTVTHIKGEYRDRK